MDVAAVEDKLEIGRREFVVSSIAALSFGGVERQPAQIDSTEGGEYQAIATLEGPRDARPTVKELTEDRIVYAYRYVDEVTKASWYVNDELEQWHPEPVGFSDVATDNGEAHSVSIVSRDGDLFVRRYE